MTIIHDLASVNSGKTKSNMALFQKYNLYNICIFFLQTLDFLRRFDLSQYLHVKMQLVWYWTVHFLKMFATTILRVDKTKQIHVISFL